MEISRNICDRTKGQIKQNQGLYSEYNSFKYPFNFLLEKKMSFIDFNLLPNFLVIGSPRCGTSSLHNVLAQHPKIFAAKEKELHFFDHDQYHNGMLWYQNRYFSRAGGYLARGETTPNYLTMAHLVAPRINESYGSERIKFIAIFRDPVKRVYSHYWYRRNRARETAMTFNEALESEWRGERDELESIYRAGCYASLLKMFFKLFSRENFHLMLMEDYLTRFHESMNRVNHFLELPEEFDYRPIHENQASAIKSARFQHVLQKKDHLLNRIGRMIKRSLPEGLAESLRSIIYQSNLTPYKAPEMDKVLEQLLRKKYFNEIKELEEIMHRDLSTWYKEVNAN